MVAGPPDAAGENTQVLHARGCLGFLPGFFIDFLVLLSDPLLNLARHGVIVCVLNQSRLLRGLASESLNGNQQQAEMLALRFRCLIGRG